MTVLRPCLDCGRPSPWSRCHEHKQARTRVRTANRQTARDVVAAQPWCTYCGSRSDLTSDHVVALARGGSNAGLQVTSCRSCNSARGGALGGNDRPRGRQ